MSIKDRIKNGEVVIGTWSMLASTQVTEILCQAGFDFIVTDQEHATITTNQIEDAVRIEELYGICPAVRVIKNDIDVIKQVMDTGAQMAVVPMIKTKEDAEKAVASVKYPTAGARGVGLARAQKYGLDLASYMEWNGKESIVILQVEHINAVNNLEEILSVPGVDGTYIGPYDLSASLGKPGDFQCPEFLEAVKKIRESQQRIL